jgi:hypothetical protein
VTGMGITGLQAVAVDDNLSSIEAAGEAGIKDRVWMKPKWREFTVGNQEGIVKIEHMGQLVEALITRFG